MRRTTWRVCAPAPKEIAEAAFGRRLDDKLSKSTVERILPCIIDGRQIPYDLVNSTIRRASNRVGFEEIWEWEKTLGISCALYRGYYSRHTDTSKRRSYNMGLENERDTRDYLFGRLLAYAEHIEAKALWIAGENRETTAAKLMQRFADRPFATWKTIEAALVPYQARLRSRSPGYLSKLNDQIDGVFSLFRSGEFEQNGKLSGEYLLGYHCQRQALRQPNQAEDQPEITIETN